MKETRQTNKHFAQNDVVFNRCCGEVGTPPTKRQAGEFRQGRGLAFVHLEKETETKKIEEVKVLLKETRQE